MNTVVSATFPIYAARTAYEPVMKTCGRISKTVLKLPSLSGIILKPKSRSIVVCLSSIGVPVVV